MELYWNVFHFDVSCIFIFVVFTRELLTCRCYLEDSRCSTVTQKLYVFRPSGVIFLLSTERLQYLIAQISNRRMRRMEKFNLDYRIRFESSAVAKIVARKFYGNPLREF